jgi:ankyrin repeat protein
MRFIRYRWVSCQLEALRRCLAPSVRRILGELPETLDETYERILQEIPKSNRAHAHRLLQCLTVAIHPLFVDELAEVLAVDFSAEGGIPKLNEDLRWEDQEQAVLSACSSLVAIVGVHGSRVVQFSHFSVKEFLTSDRLASKKDVSHYHILLEPAHTIIAQACLGVLVRLDHHIEESINGINNFPLARYAADHIGDHMEFGDVLPRIPDEIDHFLDPDEPHFAAWLWLRESLSWGKSPEALPLYYVAEFGFCGLVKHLILKRSQDSSTRGPHGMPLHIALRKGHAKMSRLLLDYCEDMDVRDPENQTPLHIAAEGGFLDVIRILLNRNADINARDNRDRTPLFRAITWTNHGLYADEVGPLLGHEADEGTRNTSHSIPPRLALFNVSVRATKLLLDNGANVHIRDDIGQTPLHRASDGNHVDVMLLLLQHGAGVDVQDNGYSTALHLASDLGGLEAVRLLLENGANPNIRNDRGQTPLHLASEWNHVGRTRLLLKCGADVDVQDNDHSTPLHLASYNKSLEATQLLLEHGAGIDVQNNEGRTPLHLASESDDGEMIRLLLGLGAALGARDDSDLTLAALKY